MNFTVALTEDNQLNRNTFLQKIQMLGNMQVVFVAANGQQCLEELKGMPVDKLPQVIFIDLEMPLMDGIETIRLAKSIYPQIHFIVLTVFDDDDKIFDAIKAGASGYLLKHEPAGVLQESVMNVIDFGGAPMSPAIARKALQLMSRATMPNETISNPLPEMITNREEEILKYMVDGWDAKKISTVLHISVLTVRKHIANIYEKLYVQSRAEIINMAHHNKWFNK
ncbi:MAG: response regulator transcription factor [Niastella sp.]|nr:response regulator transcription factor [Niastella sp.]